MLPSKSTANATASRFARLLPRPPKLLLSLPPFRLSVLRPPATSPPLSCFVSDGVLATNPSDNGAVPDQAHAGQPNLHTVVRMLTNDFNIASLGGTNPTGRWNALTSRPSFPQTAFASS